MKRYIIREVPFAHCKRGPERCEKCRTMNVTRICLLDIAPPDPGTIQRRVIQVTIDGEESWREFDVMRSFESREEAQAYAAANGIEDVAL